MPKQKKASDNTARIPTPSIDLTDAPSEETSSDRQTPNHGTAEPSNRESQEPANQRTAELPNQHTSEPSHQRTTEPQDNVRDSGTGRVSASSGFAEAPLTYEAMIDPQAPISRKKIGVHIDEVAFDASSEAWREMLRIDNNLNRGVVVEAALRVALADFAKHGRDSSLWKMVERIHQTES